MTHGFQALISHKPKRGHHKIIGRSPGLKHISPDGNSLLVEKLNEPPESGGDVLYALWDEMKPLLTSHVK